MPRKPGNEALAVLRCQSAMVVLVLLQVCERTLNLVVRIWLSLAVLPLKGEQVGKIKVQTVHRCSQPLVRVVHLPVFV